MLHLTRAVGVTVALAGSSERVTIALIVRSTPAWLNWLEEAGNQGMKGIDGEGIFNSRFQKHKAMVERWF